MFNVLLLIALALIFARILGYLFDRLNQPAVVGEILAGIFLGGIVIAAFSGQILVFYCYTIPLPKLDFNSNEFVLIAEIGILFLLFISGLEIRMPKLKKMERASFFVAVGGVMFPLAFGIFSGLSFDFSSQESIVIGLILVATSVGVTVRTLMDLHVLDTDVGTTLLGSAVIDDILGIILLAFVLGIESLMDAVWISIRIAVFFLVFLIIGLKIIDKILDLGEKIRLHKAFLSISLSILLIYSFFADRSGISGIIGAFIAGLLIGQTVRSHKIANDVKTVGYGFFIPLFFVWVGASLWENSSSDFLSLAAIGVFSTVIIVVAIAGKIIGCGVGAKLAGMDSRESLQIGVGMIPRMELALIIASAAVSHGMLTGNDAHKVLVTTVLLTIVTSLVAPFLIKATFKRQ